MHRNYLVSSFLTAASLLCLPQHCAGKYVWTGAVTDSTFDIVIEASANDVLVVYRLSSRADSRNVTVPAPKLGLAKVHVAGLRPSTRYAYSLASLGEDSPPLGTVTTFPPATKDIAFLFAFGSGSKWIKNGISWREVAKRRPDFMLHIGDLHNSDISVNDSSLYKNALHTVVTNPGAQSVFSSMAVPYIYNDHDFGTNRANISSPSREAAYEAYSSFTPHYPLEHSGQEGMYQAFTFGTARFLISDTRSMADLNGATTLGTAQREWLFRELGDWRKYSVVVWVTSKPWIGKAVAGDDKWMGYADERKQISNFIAREGITNLLVLAGGSQMMAADKGQHTDYSDLPDNERKGGAGFPILHSSPMANVGSSSTGPMSEGCFAYKSFPNHQYATLAITYHGNIAYPATRKVCYWYNGWVVGEKSPRIKAYGCITAETPSWVVRGIPGGGQGTCEIPLWPPWVSWAVLGVLGGLGVNIAMWATF